MKNRNVSKNIYILKGFYNNKKGGAPGHTAQAPVGRPQF